MCVLFIRGRTSTALFYPRQANFLIKNILHFWTMCNFQKPLIIRGYFTFSKNPPWLPEGECVPLTPTTQISTSRSPPLITKIPPQNTKKSFENYFAAPSKSPLFSTISIFLKIPQFHRITLKSHSKITKPQVKSTHSRTKSNNPIPIT